MKILVTGAAGFIGFFVAKALLEKGHTLVGLDNINDYYDIDLKYARLKELGVRRQDAEQRHLLAQSGLHPLFQFVRMDLEDRTALPHLFEEHGFEVVCNLAAQAGIRYSLEKPEAYVDSNIVGFLNLLECCRHHSVQHLVYASSSSVYGLNTKVPFEIADKVDHPISIYAATKRSNELMAHTYSHLFGFPTTGLRFFTVYGPWGRPDMAYYKFTQNILDNTPIPIFNYGNLSRDFTFVDDIVNGLVIIIEKGFRPHDNTAKMAALYNIGRGQPINLMDFVKTIGKHVNKEVQMKMLPMQDGDVHTTWADTTALEKNYGYAPQVDLDIGVQKFIAWYMAYKK